MAADLDYEPGFTERDGCASTITAEFGECIDAKAARGPAVWATPKIAGIEL